MGTCLLQANFSPQQVKLLDMSTSQALVLLAFNDSEELTFDKLRSITGLSQEEMKR